MSDQPLTGAALHRKIYDELDHRLRNSSFDGGVSEAHGLLCGLLTQGIDADQIDRQAGLFRLEEGEELDALRHLGQMAARDLEARESRFSLLLPPDEHSLMARTEALSSWCDGFLLGLYTDNEKNVSTLSKDASEALHDLLEITHLETGKIEPSEGERALFDLEEYVRSVVQFLFEESSQSRRTIANRRQPTNA